MRRTRKKPTVWEALNEPVVEVTPEAARTIFTVAVFVLMMAWVAPYMGSHNANLANDMRTLRTGEVAGAQIQVRSTPAWYYIASDASEAVVVAFSEAAHEVLDISEPVIEIAEFYEPGVDAVWDAWLDLMKDPEFTNS